jgi:hypothetical protein
MRHLIGLASEIKLGQQTVTPPHGRNSKNAITQWQNKAANLACRGKPPANTLEARQMYRPARPLEELALDLLFESYGEDRYNRSTEDYARLIALVPRLKKAHFRVNKTLQAELSSGQQRWSAIVRFKAGDAAPRYEPFPNSISIDTIRNALNYSGFRAPKRKKRH